MTDHETLKVYDARARDYARLAVDPQENLHLRAFIDALPRGGRVLDLGCGPGTWAAIMAEAGLVVEAVDASAEMVRLAARKPGVEARRAAFEEIEGDAIYDGIWANFSLLHAPRADLPRHLAALARALKAGGLLHIGMKTGAGVTRDALGRRYTYVSIAELDAMLTGAGLALRSQATGAGEGLDGQIAPWVVMTARKTG